MLIYHNYYTKQQFVFTGHGQIENVEVSSTKKNPYRNCCRSNSKSPVQAGISSKLKVPNTKKIRKTQSPQYMERFLKTQISDTGRKNRKNAKFPVQGNAA